ncbi:MULTISPECIES: sigma-70 family RNA polymerase sigma factor family protein [Streptomyces]|uniref:Uncharacterized protein n=1 Tax=Streptomyces lonegramiae TaxID=3075524 RepID=A0ABU2XDN6_9ACTN|nr:hypothetical protein [Streptomyces sp. DSM 41529]MDT0543675.1 hypothetical protein [Streptomyces sp. DSM 41529]
MPAYACGTRCARTSSRRDARSIAPGATFTADGGSLVRAAFRPIEGGERIAHNIVVVAGRTADGVTIPEHTVNGRPGLMVQRGGGTQAAYAFDVADGRIKHIWAVRNPAKLRPRAAG